MTIDVMKALPKDTKRSLLLPNLARSRKPVRRSLFGEVDHEESMRFLNRELDSIHKNDARRWNFDFVDERPINASPAKYEWEAVQPTDEIHPTYALTRLPFLAANSALKESDSSADVCHGGCDSTNERLQSVECAPKSVTSKGLVQRSMLDYLKTKKRPASPPPTKPDSSSDLAIEATESLSYHQNFSEKRIRRC